MMDEVESGESDVDVLVRRALGVMEEARRRIKDHEAEKHSGYGPTVSDMVCELLALEDAAKKVRGDAPDPRPGYSKTTIQNGVRDNETREYHESFGVIRMGRIQSMGRSGHSRLFGSSLDMHPMVIELEICRAERLRGEMDNARYWPMSGKSNQVASVKMSMAQFSELIMGVDSFGGVPCTLDTVAGTSMEPVPDEVKHEHEEIIDDVRRLVGQGKIAKEALDKAVEIIGKKSINKGDRRELLRLLETIAKGGTQGLAFYMERFNEAAEKVRSSIKSDIEATLSGVLQRLGERALARGDESIESVGKQLGQGNG